jgi:uncharacterized protein YqjF (DUF2071 family)
MPEPFLTARWEHLVLLNYAVPPALLAPLVPRGTELDAWQGTTLVSLVGFLFRETRVGGFAVPAHRTFPEVNLRFYVCRLDGTGAPRRAVVFIRELVPRLVIALIARWRYNEPYTRVPLTHAIALDETGGSIRYRWRYRKHAFGLEAVVDGPPRPLEPGSEAEFIAEHYFGYTRQRDGRTLEYQVEHPPWRIWTPTTARFEGPATLLYGQAFGDVLSGSPRSVYVAEGSAVTVHVGHLL